MPLRQCGTRWLPAVMATRLALCGLCRGWRTDTGFTRRVMTFRKASKFGDFKPGGKEIQDMLDESEGWNRALAVFNGVQPVKRDGGWGRHDAGKVADAQAEYRDKLEVFRGFRNMRGAFDGEGIGMSFHIDPNTGDVFPRFDFRQYEANNPAPQREGDEAGKKRNASDDRVMLMFKTADPNLTGEQLAELAPELRTIEARRKGKLEDFGVMSYTPAARFTRAHKNLWGAEGAHINPAVKDLFEDPQFHSAFTSRVSPLYLFRPSDGEVKYQIERNADGSPTDYRYGMMGEAAAMVYAADKAKKFASQEIVPGENRAEYMADIVDSWYSGIGVGRPTRNGETDYKNPFGGTLKGIGDGAGLARLHRRQRRTLQGDERDKGIGG